jgi:hypothetical protein
MAGKTIYVMARGYTKGKNRASAATVSKTIAVARK